MKISTTRAWLCALLLGGGVAALPGMLRADPAQIQTEAYILVMQADQAREEGRPAEAADFYQTARDLFQRLQAEYPGWEERVVQYRLTYCNNQLLLLQQEIPAPSPTPRAPQPTAPPPVASNAELDYLRSRVEMLENELAQADALQDEIHRLQIENQSLQTTRQEAGRAYDEKEIHIAQLEQQIAQIAARLESYTGMEADLAGERLLNQRLHAEFDALSRQYFDITNDVAQTPAPEMLPAEEIRGLLNQGEYQRAYDAAVHALQETPTDKNLLLLQSIALINLRDYRAAAAILTPLAKANKQDANIYAALGAALLGAGHTTQARDIFEHTLRLDENLPEAHYNLAQIYALFPPENPEKALTHYERALALGFPPNPRLAAKLK